MISAASGAQGTGVAQALKALVQIDQATQQNAALVARSADCANKLKVQASPRVNAVAVFQLQQGTLPNGATPTAQCASSRRDTPMRRGIAAAWCHRLAR